MTHDQYGERPAEPSFPAYPPGPPGYPPPPPPYGAAMPGQPPPPYDPLVAYDFASWVDRLLGVVKRSWKRLLTLLVLGAVLPILGVIVSFAGIALALVFGLGLTDGAQVPVEVVVPVAILCYLALLVILLYLVTVTNLAAIKVATNDAAGQRIALGQAYRSCLRLGWPTLGWTVLGGLVTALGFLACVLPGLYLTVALSLLLPIMVFQRRNGFAGSFRLVHRNFWPVAGRIAALYGLMVAVSYAVQFLSYFLMIPAMVVLDSGQEAPSVGAIAGLVVLGAAAAILVLLANLLSQVVLLCGQLVTYAELRGRLQPGLTTAHLVTELPA